MSLAQLITTAEPQIQALLDHANSNTLEPSEVEQAQAFARKLLELANTIHGQAYALECECQEAGTSD